MKYRRWMCFGCKREQVNGTPTTQRYDKVWHILTNANDPNEKALCGPVERERWPQGELLEAGE